MALARASVEIVGIDIDPVMVAAAKRRFLASDSLPKQGEWPTFIAADMRRFTLVRRFKLVFVGYNSLQLLTAPGDMTACLKRAREHLTTDGRVGVEVTDFQFGGADGPDDPDREVDGRALVPLAEVDGIRLSGTLEHDLARRTSRYRRHFAGDGWAVDNDVVVRSVDRDELDALFAEAGLAPAEWWVEGTTTRAVATAAG